MIQGQFSIIQNDKVSSDCYKLKILAPKIAKESQPGQFVHIKIQQKNGPLLRRPFAVHNAEQNKILEVLYKIRGQGTSILSSKAKNDKLDIIGPLGHGFNIDSKSKEAFIIAGGMGIAPLLFLIKELVKKGKKVISFIGSSCEDNILCYDEINKLQGELVLATEDGSKGKKGKVTEIFRDYLKNVKKKNGEIFAAGPKAMLEEISKLSYHFNIPAQLSLDEIIACGVGACLGCAVKTKKGYKLACKDGPIFKADEIIWQ
jgi:dihydroorotate dehydrogenase electron transfer subunit